MMRFFGAYARDDKGDVVPHEEEIIGAHLWEVMWGYDDNGKVDIDGAYLIQARTAQEAFDAAKVLFERDNWQGAILGPIRCAMW